MDSWTLWNAVAGGEQAGRRWRGEYLRATYATGAYRSYETMVAEAADLVGLPWRAAEELGERYGELLPWPGVIEALRGLAGLGVPLRVVTNCSERLGRIAADAVGVAFDAVVTAERAGFYKPDARPYRLGLAELGVDVSRGLFVAGSPYDLVGTGPLGLATYWHDRSGMAMPPGAVAPIARAEDLGGLVGFVMGT